MRLLFSVVTASLSRRQWLLVDGSARLKPCPGQVLLAVACLYGVGQVLVGLAKPDGPPAQGTRTVERILLGQPSQAGVAEHVTARVGNMGMVVQVQTDRTQQVVRRITEETVVFSRHPFFD